MTRKTVLLELLDDNQRRIEKLLTAEQQGYLYWSPDDGGNSIAVTIWHAARVHDVFLTQHIHARPADREIWFASGWAEKCGYDPRGIGTLGWGAVTGYSLEEVKAMPAFEADTLLGYFEEVAAAIRTYLDETPEEMLDEPSRGFEGKQTNYHWIRHPLFDTTRHVGEALAFKAMWERSNLS